MSDSDRKPFRAGDVVRHGPSKEKWVLACDEWAEHVYPAGWPETQADATDCELVEAASDDARLKMLLDVARDSPARESSFRHLLAKRQLSQENDDG